MRPMTGVWPIYTSLGGNLWQRVSLPGKGPRKLTLHGSTAYITQYFSDDVAVVDLQSDVLTASHTIPVGPPPALTVARRGELLFNDATLCYQQWISCASCHPDGRVDGLNWDLLNDGVGNSKNTRSMLLAHRTPPSMATGVRTSAELAVRSGLAHILFADRPEEEAVAIDAYLRSLKPVLSPYLVDGELSAAAKRGRSLFHGKRVACHRCHPAPLYTDLRLHPVGTKKLYDRNVRFDTSSLVEAWRTAPYMHDGRHMTIKEVLVKGGHGLRKDESDSMSDSEIDDLVEFVLSL
jgi:cytochrome c peroxidase